MHYEIAEAAQSARFRACEEIMSAAANMAPLARGAALRPHALAVVPLEDEVTIALQRLATMQWQIGRCGKALPKQFTAFWLPQVRRVGLRREKRPSDQWISGHGAVEFGTYTVPCDVDAFLDDLEFVMGEA